MIKRSKLNIFAEIVAYGSLHFDVIFDSSLPLFKNKKSVKYHINQITLHVSFVHFCLNFLLLYIQRERERLQATQGLKLSPPPSHTKQKSPFWCIFSIPKNAACKILPRPPLETLVRASSLSFAAVKTPIFNL